MLIRSFKGALVTGIAIFALITAQEVARAGQYHVYSCRMPDGGSAPTDGWSGAVAAGGAWDDYLVNTCSEGGAMVAALGDATQHAAEVDRATWSAAIPPALKLSNATIWRAGYLTGQGGENATYQLWVTGQNPSAPFDECIFSLGCQSEGELGQPFQASNRVALPAALAGNTLAANVNCGVIPGHVCQSKGDPNGYAAALYLYAADLTLEQPEGPHAANVAGELASAPTLRGAPDLSFDATDPGAGVYEALFAIDGQPLQRMVLNDNGGRCRDVGETTDGLPAFLYLQPCPQSISADVPFDSRRVANGPHRLTVSVLDAAGNAAPVLSRVVNVDNPPPPGAPNGANASSPANLSVRWSGTAKTSARGGFTRAHTVTGRLTAPAGGPIAGASIEVHATPAYSGARAVAMTSPRTDARGAFALSVPPGTSSRTLRFAYRAHVGDPQPAAIRALRLRTPASVALKVTPRTASAGSSIYFRGRLRGGPIPRDGKSLVLEARSPGSGWLQFKVIRTDRRGRFRASYRFKFPGPADYSFRLRCEAESDFPFAPGYSNVVGVRER